MVRIPAALAVIASFGLGGCAYNDWGYGGVSVGYGTGGYYDGYYGDGGYYGWYDGYYYPGWGYYVYDDGGHRHRTRRMGQRRGGEADRILRRHEIADRLHQCAPAAVHDPHALGRAGRATGGDDGGQLIGIADGVSEIGRVCPEALSNRAHEAR